MISVGPGFNRLFKVYQLDTTNTKLIITHPIAQSVAVAAAQQAQKPVPSSHILYFSVPPPGPQTEPNISTLIATGLQKPIAYVERRLAPGEGKTKLALLAFSSGTTGRPKAVAIPHYAVIANIVQMSMFNKVTEEYDVHERRRIRVGDRCLGGACLAYLFCVCQYRLWYFEKFYRYIVSTQLAFIIFQLMPNRSKDIYGLVINVC